MLYYMHIKRHQFYYAYTEPNHLTKALISTSLTFDYKVNKAISNTIFGNHAIHQRDFQTDKFCFISQQERLLCYSFEVSRRVETLRMSNPTNVLIRMRTEKILLYLVKMCLSHIPKLISPAQASKATTNHRKSIRFGHWDGQFIHLKTHEIYINNYEDTHKYLNNIRHSSGEKRHL